MILAALEHEHSVMTGESYHDAVLGSKYIRKDDGGFFLYN